MSLINDALNRARAEEAARRDAEGRGEVPRPVPPPARKAVRPATIYWLAALAAFGAGALWLWPESGGDDMRATRQVASARADATSEETGFPGRSPRSEGSVGANDAAMIELDLPARANGEPVASSAEAAARSAGQPPSEAGASTAETTGEPRVSKSPDPETTSAQPRPADTARTGLLGSAPEMPEPARAGPSLASPSSAVSAPDAAVDLAPPAAPTPDSTPATTPPTGPAAVWPADGEDEETWYYVGTFDLPGGGEIELAGIAWSAASPSAMLNGALLGVGDEILGLRVVAIEPRTVILAGRGQRVALQLGPSSRP